MKFKVKKKYHAIFEKAEDPEPGLDSLIYVKYQDLDGLIHFEYCSDLLQTNYTMTETKLFRDFQRVRLN